MKGKIRMNLIKHILFALVLVPVVALSQTNWVDSGEIWGQGVTGPNHISNDPTATQFANFDAVIFSSGDPGTTPIKTDLYLALVGTGNEFLLFNTPILSPGESGFDSTRVETPTLCKDSGGLAIKNGAYHLFYQGGSSGGVAIGHATSTNLSVWNKQGAVISSPGGVGEPSCIMRGGWFWLYYTKNVTVNGQLESQIYLQLSQNGVDWFQWARAVASRPVAEATQAHGYTAPEVYINAAGKVLLTVTFHVANQKVAIDQMELMHGITPTNQVFGVVVAGQPNRFNHEVWGAAMVNENKMYMVGHTENPFNQSIGVMTK